MRGVSLLLFPLPLARNKENGNIESKILIGCECAPCTMIPVYTLLTQGKDCCWWGRILKHCVRDELARINIFLSKISTPFLTFLIPFAIIKAEFWHNEYSQNFQTLLGAVTFFQLARILRNLSLKLTFNSCWVKHSWSENNIENCKFIWYLLLTNSNFLLYLIWYFWRQDIKLNNSMNQKYMSKCILPLSTRD